MREYILRRLLLIPLIAVAITLLTFLTFRIIPGDVAIFFCGFSCTPETLHDIRHELALDKPIYEQYTDWLTGIAKGDLGTSYLTKLPVTTELNRRYPVTLELLVLALSLSLVLGMPAGVLSAVRPGTIIDSVVRFISVLFQSVPSFYSAILIIIFGAKWFSWSPPNFATGAAPGLFSHPLQNMESFLPPALVLSVGSAAIIMRLTRSSMLEVMRNDYIRTAYSKGLRERVVVWRHALKNAMIPIVTIIGLEAGGLLGGTVLVESVFGLNGIGSYLVFSIVTRDLQVVQALVLIFAATYITINLAVDVSYAWLDPRIHYQTGR
jgi:peptide/nickel transport system permease protein